MSACLIIEGHADKSEYMWWRALSGCDVIPACGNYNLYGTCIAALLKYSIVTCVIDYLEDNLVTCEIKAQLHSLELYYPSLHLFTYPGFEASLLKCVPVELQRQPSIVTTFLDNLGHWETAPILVQYAAQSLSGYVGKSSEWFSSQLMLKVVDQCVGVSKSALGDYWKVNCPALVCVCRYEVAAMLLTKQNDYIESNGFCALLELLLEAKISMSIPQSMIDNYGSYELALQHLKEMGMI